MLKIRRPLGRLIFNMGIAIPGKTVFLIETAPGYSNAQCTPSNILPTLPLYYISNSCNCFDIMFSRLMLDSILIYVKPYAWFYDILNYPLLCYQWCWLVNFNFLKCFIPANEFRMYLNSQVHGTNDYVNAVCVDVRTVSKGWNSYISMECELDCMICLRRTLNTILNNRVAGDFICPYVNVMSN